MHLIVCVYVFLCLLVCVRVLAHVYVCTTFIGSPQKSKKDARMPVTKVAEFVNRHASAGNWI